MALPSKGRLAEPALALVRDAGLELEVGERRLFTPCRNFPLDVLFVRANDIPEHVRDGIVDLGITGTDLIEESGLPLKRGPKLGFGACRLQVAVPAQGAVARLEDLAGARVATSHPRLTLAHFERRGVAVRLVAVAGSVEVTPLLGVADAIGDLVSSGSTLAANGLRPVETILDSEAELVLAPNGRAATSELVETVQLMLASVTDGRRKRYVMMNAPTESLAAIRDLLPGLASPTVMPLAQPEMVAIHVAVDVNQVWAVLARLREVGATSILVLPVEQLLQ